MPQRFNRPWLHFLALGAGLFLLSRWLHPPPAPVVGPLGEQRVQALRQQWRDATGEPPSAAQLEGMVRAELDRDMLFQEALRRGLHRHDGVVRQRLIRNMRFLRLGEGRTDEALHREALRMELHLGDEVVKRRLVQAMERLILAGSRLVEPGEAELRARFAAERERLRRPPRYTFEHVFLARERAAEAAGLLGQIARRQWSPQRARRLGSPFLPGYRFRSQSPRQLARHFGVAFVRALQAAQPRAGQWLGPIASTYGAHLVWVERIEPARDAELEEVRAQLRRDLLLERRDNALRDGVARLRRRYEVLP